MKIDNVLSTQFNKEIAGFDRFNEDKIGDSGFKEMLTNSLASVNQTLQKADEASAAVATGKSENLHDAMVSFEKAETALKFLVQVRNKAIDAYQEIMRMQV